MSRSIANVETSNDTFGSWINKTNELATVFSETVTVKANTAGDTTSGNGFVIGIFGSNTLISTNLRGGSVTTSANLNVTSNTLIGNSSSQVTITHNSTSHVKSSTYTTTNTDAQIMDSFATTDYRTCKYLISMHETDSNEYQSTEIMLLQDGSLVYTTEYATLISSTTLAQFTANINSGTVRLYVVPSFSNNVISYQRTALAV